MAMQINKIKRKLAKNKHGESELFDVHDIMEYGFPSSPSAIAYDEHLGLLALVTSSGELRVYGRTGVLVSTTHKDISAVSQLVWVPNEGRLISLGEKKGQSTLTLFELNKKSGVKSVILEAVKELVLDTKKATKCSLVPAEGKLLIGTEVGDTLVMDVSSFELKEETIHVDVAMQSVPEDLKLTPGSVQVVEPHPSNKELVLIGYHSGLMVVWNLEDKLAQGTFFISCSALESASWMGEGDGFVSAHADGSYYRWTLNAECQPVQSFPFADPLEPAQRITKLQLYHCERGDFMVFSGGLPKNMYTSTHSFTVHHGEAQINYETASKIVDFEVIYSLETLATEPTEQTTEGETEEAEKPEPTVVRKVSALAVLTEDELIMIDLTSTEGEDEKEPQWPVFRKPYLNSASPNDITCLYIHEDCGGLLEKLVQMGDSMFAGKSKSDWPIFGGSVESKASEKLNIAVTGHYDGSVRFYDVNGGKFELLYVLNMNNYFQPEDIDEESAANESLGDVILRKVGEEFGLCGDDNRFAVCKLYICPKTEKLFIGSHSGQVVVFELGETTPANIEINEVKIVPDDAGFRWKGAHPAKLKDLSAESLPSGYVLKTVVQCEPPAPITSMAVNEKYGLIAAGTSHGFGVFDMVLSKTALTRSTLVENDEVASGAKLSKSKSLREGIRNSFRKLKPKKTEATAEPTASTPKSEASTSKPTEVKSEDPKPTEEEKPAADAEKKEGEDKSKEGEVEEKKEEPEASAEPSPAEETKPEEPEKTAEEPKTVEEVKEQEKAPVEPVVAPEPAPAAPSVTIMETEEQKEGQMAARVVEARGERQDKTMMSTVRYLFFADTFLRNSKDNSPSLWVGTHAGSVYSYLITLPEERESEEAKLRLAKEIKLLHRAPVVYMNILDHSGFPLPDASAVAAQKVSAADMSGHHHLLVCSEEQMKLFTLPALKSKYKEKLTAVHGLKVRKVAPIKHRSEGASSNFLACMLNDGSVCTFSLPALYRQYNYNLVNSENKIACMFTEFDNEGFAYVLQQTNLVRQYAMFKDTESPMVVTVALPEGCRPLPPVEVEPEPTPAAETEKEEEKAEAENAENVESAAPGGETEEKAEDGEPKDLPTVEEEAKKMIDDAEDLKDAEFQKRIQEELTPDNPELTTTTVTTYRAIESRTIISSDDGTQCAKIITTTRDTTLSLDGDVITQKTQQKEEFEVSPSDEQPPSEGAPVADSEGQDKQAEEVNVEGVEDDDKDREEVTTVVQTVTVVGADGEEREIEHQTVVEKDAADEPKEEEPQQKSGSATSDEELNQELHAEVESLPVRTATLTENETVEPAPTEEESAAPEDVDHVTHHIGGHEGEEQTEGAVDPKADVAVESAPAESEAPEESNEAAAAEEVKEPEAGKEPEEKPAEEKEPADGVDGECYGGSQGHLYSPLAAENSEEPSESPVADDEPEDGVTGACYGGSNGALYSPMGREGTENEQNGDIIYNGETGNEQTGESQENGDMNGHEGINGHENGHVENGNGIEEAPENVAETGDVAENGESENAGADGEVLKKASIASASEQNTASEELNVEAAESNE